jgi:hypothetical protein
MTGNIPEFGKSSANRGLSEATSYKRNSEDTRRPDSMPSAAASCGPSELPTETHQHFACAMAAETSEPTSYPRLDTKHRRRELALASKGLGWPPTAACRSAYLLHEKRSQSKLPFPPEKVLISSEILSGRTNSGLSASWPMVSHISLRYQLLSSVFRLSFGIHHRPIWHPIIRFTFLTIRASTLLKQTGPSSLIHAVKELKNGVSLDSDDAI